MEKNEPPKNNVYKGVYSNNVWFSPKYAIYLLWNLKNKLGDVVLKSDKFKKEREAWVTGVALLAINKMTNNLWWLQVPIEDPPDMLAMTLISNLKENRNYMNYRYIEVMEINRHSSVDIETEIINKVSDKFYPKETCLLVHIKKDILIMDMKMMSENIHNKIHHLADIWLLGNTKPATNDFILFSIFPKVEVVNFNINEEMDKLPTAMTFEFMRAKGIKIQKFRAPLIWRFKP